MLLVEFLLSNQNAWSEKQLYKTTYITETWDCCNFFFLMAIYSHFQGKLTDTRAHNVKEVVFISRGKTGASWYTWDS